MDKDIREGMLEATHKACELLRKIYADAAQLGNADDIRAADEAYRRAAMLRDHLENVQ